MNIKNKINNYINENLVLPRVNEQVNQKISNWIKNYYQPRWKGISSLVDEAILEIKRERLYNHFKSFNEVKYGDRERIIPTFSTAENDAIEQVQQVIKRKLKESFK